MNPLILSSDITFILLFLILILLLYKYVTISYNYWKDRHIPFIQPSFPFGNCIKVITRHSSIGKFLEDVYNKCNGEMVGFWVFNSPFLLIKSQRMIKNILIKDFNNFSDRTIANNEKADPISSKLLFLIKNPEWKLIRKKITPVFTSNKLRKMTALMNDAAMDLNKYMNKNVGVLEVKEVAAKYTTDLLTTCAFGVNAHSFDDEDAPFRKVGRKMVEINWLNGIRFNAYFLWPSLVRLLRIPFFDLGSVNFLASAFWDTIKQRELSKKKRNDLIDIIIKLREEVDIGDGIKFEGDRVVAQAVQFFFAGFETTSSTISFILYELALDKEIQGKIRDEINLTLKNHGNYLDYDTLQNMNYSEKVILETLRKHPILPFLDRTCVADYKDPELDVVIPKGTPLFISSKGIHYDPEFYPDPEKFDPERFSEENVNKRPAFTYFPFGQGPRNCIGQRFAIISTKLSLVHILKDFEVEPCKETPRPLVYNPGSFFHEIKGGMSLRFKKI